NRCRKRNRHFTITRRGAVKGGQIRHRRSPGRTITTWPCGKGRSVKTDRKDICLQNKKRIFVLVNKIYPRSHYIRPDTSRLIFKRKKAIRKIRIFDSKI